eukprot:CAMPEP_0206011740 /NCGR_PEP_ID=MMETSP1464-20131121/13747_1 /ASSEMBLY_ACC=CAM_ASM_001124 /TAXON_ID=119497 /ORGANISM="Exanthemachrysis gayraliae, Strain RCC1523" /LENGTH=242 /DNA_ID=CAMNT_0053385419 /DNA_START=23 /DNA_END=752 /DNA_ORIENTATION=+
MPAADGEPLADPHAPRSDGPTASASASAGAKQTDPKALVEKARRSIRETVERVEVTTRAMDGATLRHFLGLAYLANIAIISLSVVADLLGNIMHNGSFIRGFAGLGLLLVAAAMAVHELRLEPAASQLETYALFLATVPGRVVLMAVLGVIVVEMNWLGWIAFWCAMATCAAFAYVRVTHPWFADHADDPALFRVQPPPPTYRDERDLEIADDALRTAGAACATQHGRIVPTRTPGAVPSAI